MSSIHARKCLSFLSDMSAHFNRSVMRSGVSSIHARKCLSFISDMSPYFY